MKLNNAGKFEVCLYTFLFIFSGLSSTAPQAEIVPDGIFSGSSEALAGPDFRITAAMGLQMGGNLFHSFESFSVQRDETATFTGSESVTNIISRVTGKTPSFIDGRIVSEIPDADVYLLNPGGIVFGEHATLDVQGSFYLSSADTVYLGASGHFDARAPEHSVLTTAPPVRFGFLSERPANIDIRGSRLQVPAGKTLSITGGNLLIENSALRAPGGSVELASLASEGEMGLASPHMIKAEKSGTVTLSQTQEADTKTANIDASGAGGGRVFIQAGRFLSQGGLIVSAIMAGDGDSSEAGQVAITATQEIRLQNAGISVASAADAGKNAGDIRLQTGRLTLEDGGFLNGGALGSGRGGDISVTANQGVFLSGESLITAGIGNRATASSGDGGDIYIKTPRLEIKDFSAVQTGAFK
ncbi:MAG: filamentous hemagglutinin N-terminal domain-containing protein, partial [Gammaproteobacteria bacterium]|nr:filamentous hemagglutinin N-terminal domain-containing protein [Gammaproteobacteria bacterium]